MGADRTAPQSGRRVTVDEAARHLGLTVDAVRKRMQRGQIAYEKDVAGRVRIILDEGETLQDESPDAAGQATISPDARDELIEELRDRVRHLERRLDEEREARTEERRRHDTLIAQLTSRIPQLEAPTDALGARMSATEEPETAEPRSTTGGAQEGAERSWWRRLFGG